MADIAVQDVGQDGYVDRTDDVFLLAHDLKVRQAHHVLDLFGGQPGFGRLAVLEAEKFPDLQCRLPEAGVAIDQEPGPVMAKWMESFEELNYYRASLFLPTVS